MTMQAIRAEPNVTPMIHVMLVLLIVFMAVGQLLLLPYRRVQDAMALAVDAGARTIGLVSEQPAGARSPGFIR